MKHANVLSLAMMTTKWSILLLCVIFSQANSQDPNNNNTPAGLLCISDCSTCPVICSPPPSPVKLKPPPSPSSVLVQAPPPPPLFAPLRPSPSQSSPRSPSPSSSQPSPKSPPPSYITYIGAPPPPSSRSSNCPTPPNAPNIINIPATQAPPVNGQKNYTYPYYYFYVSKAASLPLHGSIVLGFLVVFHFLCIFW
uniref:Proline-rich receptor-like protein kinase PERK2 n=1 Tax=Nicotiana tabacum TaxID=4097 RepID=A0A1S4BH04_TOBAC|nr:PREDICTED: proline-rich receptor-like protein kinase PERK2 [Nicotiana tabacum]